MNKIIIKDTNNVGVILDVENNVRGVVRSRGNHDIVPKILEAITEEYCLIDCEIVSVSFLKHNYSWDIVVKMEEDGDENRQEFNIMESVTY
jgi:hypothetical protein